MKPGIAFAKCITFIVALQILNISIYAQDIAFMQQNQQTIFFKNEINSVAEYISEVILKHTNAFPEYPNDGHKQSQLSKHIDLNTFAFQPFTAPVQVGPFANYIYPQNTTYNFLFFKEINPPPPKA